MPIALAITLAAGCGRVGFERTAGDASSPEDAVDSAAAVPNLAFLTSTRHTGALGGRAGADAICQATATQAGLAGTFISLLRDSASDHPRPSARGWVDRTGRPILYDASGWFVGKMIYPLERDEAGALVTDQIVWSGNDFFCSDWSTAMNGVAGGVAFVDEAFSDFPNNTGCNQPLRLPCIQVDHTFAISPPQQAGRIAFLTQARFSSGGGFPAADALCASEATAAGLAGTFRALVGDATTTPESRFSLTGLPWRRVDGVQIAPTAAGLFDPAQRVTFLTLTAQGQATDFINAWRGDATSSCNSFLSTTGNGATVAPTAKGSAFDHLGEASCNSAYPLVCLQE